MKATFEKKGFKVEVMLEGTEIKCTVANKECEVDPKLYKGTWAYEVLTRKIRVLFGAKPSQTLYLAHESAEGMLKAKEQAKKDEIDRAFEGLKDEDTMTLRKGTSHSFFSMKNDRLLEQHPYFEKSMALIEKLWKGEIEEALEREADRVDWGDYSITNYYDITFAEYKKITEYAKHKQEERRCEAEKKKQDREQKRLAIIKKAKTTGEKQVLSRRSEPCNDPREECDVDNIIEWAMPDGTTKTTRNHTW